MQLLRRLSFTMLMMSLMTLVACGDGDGDLLGSGSDDLGDTAVEITTITLTKSDGALSAANDIVVTATLLDSGSPIANKTITFALAVDGSAILDPVSGTATTNENGVASITIKVNDVAGSVNVIANYESTTENISFDSVGDGAGTTTIDVDSAQLSLTKSEGDLANENDIIVSASLLLSDGTGLANKLVTFTLNDPEVAKFDPLVGTAITDESGLATITVKVTDVAGGVEVTATVINADGTDSAVQSIGFTSLGDGDKVIVGEPEPASIRLFASSQQLPTSGAQTILLSAIAKDDNNNLLEGVTINFASDSGALQNYEDDEGNSSQITGPDGKVEMLLSTEGEPENRTIIVTSTAGSVSDSIEITALGTTLTLTGSSSLAIDDETPYIINVLDSDGNGVAETEVAISLTATPENITVPTSVTTNAEGQATIIATGTSGGNNSIMVSALNASTSQAVSVQADSFVFTNFNNGVEAMNPSVNPELSDVALGATASITLNWLSNGAAIADGTEVSITTTRGSLSSSTQTTTGGNVTVTLTADNAGKAIVTFVGKYTVDDQDIELSNQVDFEFFADTAETITAQASPNSIGPNGQTSTISVVVKDENNNLVKNKRIKFLLSDVSGGTIFPATAVTDSSGSASTVFTSTSGSAKDAITISAVVEDTPAVEDSVNLTVADRELFISLGTGNQVGELGTTDYVKEYSVFVTDAESNAVENIDLTVSAIPDSYYKGKWVRLFDGDEFSRWVATEQATENIILDPDLAVAPQKCANEDLNFNGVLDAVPDEDTNMDGELTPGNIVSISGTFLTDTDGRSVIRIIYPKSYAHWLDVKLIVSGKVNGSESSTQTIFTLPVLASDIGNEDIYPPTQGLGTRGPFGLTDICTDNISDDPEPI